VSELRFLSFSQPWLWSITDLLEPEAKRIENRSWAPPASMIGQLFALHAAKSWDDDGMRLFSRLGIRFVPPLKADFPSSCIVGVARIVRVVRVGGAGGEDPATLPSEQQRWFFGPCGWLLDSVRKLTTPIPMRGAQGLRRLAPEIARDVMAHVA
jgi:hypothetical protein